MNNKKKLILKISVGLSYLGMIAVNFLANALPIAGKNTGEISDAFPNLFTPAGITFSIWGLIYLLLGAYVIYFISKKDSINEVLFEKIAKLFTLSSLTNIAWIFCWHYGLVFVSVLLMLLMLVSLILIATAIAKEKLNVKEKIFLSLPFSVYFGWITVATIANITALLVDLSWSGWGISDVTWTVVILLVGALIGIIRGLKDRNIPYLLVFVWAYFGILFKHNSVDGFSGEYPVIINTALFAMALFVLNIIYLAIRKEKV